MFTAWKVEKLVSCGNYTYAVVKNHPKATKHGYVYHHRIVIENHIGRQLEDHEVIHHLNGDRKDNRVDNLILMTNSEHTTIHNLMKGSLVCELRCPTCGKVFVRERRQTYLAKGGTRAFCSRQCNGRFPKPSPDNPVPTEIVNVISVYRRASTLGSRSPADTALFS